MDCLNPKSVRNSKTGEALTVRCGKCSPCLRSRASAWTIRMLQELKTSSNNWFITLTLSDEFLTWGFDRPTLVRRDIQLFMKRLRKLLPNRVKFYAVGEYGSKTLRPHYHLILFNTGIENKNELEWTILSAWDKGMIHAGYVTEASIRYVAGYLEKDHEGNHSTENIQREFNQMSKGIGISYIEKAQQYHIRNNKFDYSLGGGQFTALPRYYRRKIFDESKLNEYAEQIANERKAIPANHIILRRQANENRINALKSLKTKRK